MMLEKATVRLPRSGGSALLSNHHAHEGSLSPLPAFDTYPAFLSTYPIMTAEVQQMPEIHVIEKLREIPLVTSACSTGTDVYRKVKESNGILSWTFGTAEGAVMTAFGAVVPVASRLQQPISAVDSTLCKGIDVIQEKMPIVKEQPAQIVEKARSAVSDCIQPRVAQISTMTSRGYEKANEVLSSSAVGHVALSSLDSVSSVADQYIDYYLPAQEGEEDLHPHPSSACEDKIGHTVHTVGTLGAKVGRRVYRTLSARRAGQQAQPELPVATSSSHQEKPKDE